MQKLDFELQSTFLSFWDTALGVNMVQYYRLAVGGVLLKEAFHLDGY
jgi:hypothetical protein